MVKSIKTMPRLAEAWMTAKWILSSEPGIPHMLKDAAYPLIVGTFRETIREDFPVLNELDANRAPLDFLPYIPRLQFRSSGSMWPLIQIGPGLTTLNFVENYSWKDFEKYALLLRKKLTESYQKENETLRLSLMSLRYRYVFDFNYSVDNILDFIREKLNVAITLPSNIANVDQQVKLPEEINFSITYTLKEKLKGIIRLVNGTETRDKEVVKVFLVDIEVICESQQIEDVFISKDSLKTWLNQAHNISVAWLSELGIRDLA